MNVQKDAIHLLHPRKVAMQSTHNTKLPQVDSSNSWPHTQNPDMLSVCGEGDPYRKVPRRPPERVAMIFFLIHLPSDFSTEVLQALSVLFPETLPTKLTPGKFSDHNLTLLSTHPGIKYVKRSHCLTWKQAIFTLCIAESS